MDTTIVKTFESSEYGKVRVVMIDDEPWFVAKDVCDALEISNSRDALVRLDDDEKMTLNSVDTQKIMSVDSTDGHSEKRGGARMMNVVNEFGLYNLILGSRKKEAKQFKRWVTHEVLPSIRKTGAYVQPEKAEAPNNGYIPKFFGGMKVFTLRDASTLLKVRYEYLRQLLSKPQRANLQEGRDYLKLVGGLLKGFIHENSSVPSNLPSLILLFESGFNKICEYFKMKVSSIFSSDSGEIALDFEGSTNDEVEAKIEKITEQAIAQKVLARLYEMFKRSEKEEKAIRETIRALTAMSLKTTWIPEPTK